MWLIYGHTERRKRLGIVADECPLCDDLRPFLVTDHYVVSHLYFIPLGRGRLQTSLRRCQVCQGRFACDRMGYEQFVPGRQARSMALDDLLEETNPALARARQERQQLQQDAERAVAGRTPAEDERLLRWLMLGLRQVAENVPQVTYYQDRLLSWYHLPPTERERLRREIESFLEENKKLQRAALFTIVLSQQFPRGAGSVAAFFLWIWLTVCALFLSAALHLEGAGLLLVLLALLGSYLSYRAFARAAYLRWFRKKFLPPMAEYHIDLAALLTTLASVRKSPRLQDARTRALVKRADLLVQLLRAQDQPVPEADAQLQAEGQR